MNEDTLALMIPIIALIIPIIAIWTKHQRRLAEMQIMAGAGQHAQASAEATARLQALEERVRVLERIVTDAHPNGGLTLAHEIEALRGPAPAPNLATPASPRQTAAATPA